MKVKCLLAVLLLSATATAFAQEAKYGIKSAILKKEAVTMGQKVQGVQYFDDYGRKEAVRTYNESGRRGKCGETYPDDSRWR